MRLQSEQRGNALVISVEEERIDAANAVPFKEKMRWLVDDAPDRVILDLAAVDSIDSSGLGAIVSVMKHMGGERSLELAHLSEKVETVFKLTRMDTVIRLHATTDEAVEEAARAS